MKSESFTSGNYVSPADIISKIKHSHICESSVCKHELEELLHSLAYEKALPIALSNFHTHFSGIFVMP